MNKKLKNKLFYESDDWIELKKSVYSIYKPICMKCNASNSETHVDHIFPRSKFPELELDLNNMQVLCRSCNIKKGNSNNIDYRTESQKKRCNSYLEKPRKRSNTKEEFCLMFSSMVLALKSYPDVPIRMFAFFVEGYSDGKTIQMGGYLKEEISNSIGCSVRSLDNALTKLVRMKFLISLGRSAYRINPRYIFKGSTISRNKSLKAVLELECPDC